MALVEEAVHSVSPAEEAASTTVQLMKQLGLVITDEEALWTSLHNDFARLLTELGRGRPYVELPRSITTERLCELANELAAERGFSPVFRWKPFWVPGTELQSVTAQEINSVAEVITARLALFSEKATNADPLLHFLDLPYDGEYKNWGQTSQLDALAQAQRVFANQHLGASLRAADHRDFLVMYLMDLIREVSAEEVILAKGFMRVPALGRRTVDGDSYVGIVCSGGGQAYFGRSGGGAYGWDGFGLSAGFNA